MLIELSRLPHCNKILVELSGTSQTHCSVVRHYYDLITQISQPETRYE